MKYTIGHQDFRRIREEGRAYVDKTEQVCRLIDDGGYLFLSRPRRFGKSLTVATMNELYSGDAALFEGLWAGEHWDFAAKRRPVLWFKFASAGYRTGGLEAALLRLLAKEATQHDVDLGDGDNVAVRFQTLIERVAAAHPSGRVVVLVDEYDKPILDYLDDVGQAEANRDLLKNFYGVLKDANAFLELVFITGVTAFSKVSLFSELNNLSNLTLDWRAFTIVGLTQAELEANFSAQLDASRYTRDQVRQWYNGYAWGDHERVYNPWSILQFLQSDQLHNYWSNSGTPSFVTKLMAQGGDYNVAPTRMRSTEMLRFSLSKLSPRGHPFPGRLPYGKTRPGQPPSATSWTTPTRRSGGPSSWPSSRATPSRDAPVPPGVSTAYSDAFAARDLETVVEIIDVSLAAVPYQLYAQKSEAMVHAIVHTTFTVLGLYTRSEVSTSQGPRRHRGGGAGLRVRDGAQTHAGRWRRGIDVGCRRCAGAD